MFDKKTINSIIKRAKIADVVEMFSHLTPRDNNFAGYCPFCDSKMASLFIDTSNNTFTCSECGKTGTPIDFVIDMLNVNYHEALLFLAQMCGISVDYSEPKSEAAALYDINMEACKYYRSQLFDTPTGRNVALAYYRDARGFSDETINRFALGYSPDRAENKVVEQLVAMGYSEDLIVKSGIGVKFEDRPAYDRFHERITFPITNLAGKIVAFSCRTMRNDKEIAKYKNTNDTPIYTKGNEIYGLYQARESIISRGYCILVEGNADVVSMHQAGFTNTIAPLGTGFTYGQACVIRRFTGNVTLLFDGDAAGIHANEVALQHFLPLGIVPRIVLLPQGDDPDAFARRFSQSEAEQFLESNSISLVQFYLKTRLEGNINNPIRRAQVTKEIIQKIALIPNPIVHTALAKECSKLFHINESSVLQDIQKEKLLIREEELKRKQQAEFRRRYQNQDIEPPAEAANPADEAAPLDFDALSDNQSALLDALNSNAAAESNGSIINKEREIVRYIAKYGMVYFSETETRPITLIEYIDSEFNAINLSLSSPVYNKIFVLGKNLLNDFYSDLADFEQHVENNKKKNFDEGIAQIQMQNYDIATIENEEKRLKSLIERDADIEIENFRRAYFEQYLCNHPDRDIRATALSLVNEPFKLSKIHTQQANVKTEFDNLDTLVQDAIYNLRYELITLEINANERLLAQAGDADKVMEVMTTLAELQNRRKALAKELGERVINPN